MKLKLTRAAAAVLLASTASSLAIAPPREGEIQKYEQDGTLPFRTENYLRFKSDRFHPGLLSRAEAKLRQADLLNQGMSAEDVVKLAPLPPPAWRGMPTTGTNKTLTILIEFQDIKHTPVNSRDFIHRNIFGDGIPDNRPCESLTNYYKRASYGKLTITGETADWYSTPYPRDQVEQTDAGRENLIKEALKSLEQKGHDFSEYDNDGDGDIDYLMVIYAGPDNGWANFWWAYQTDWQDSSFKLDGKRLSTYIFQFQNYEHGDAFSPQVIIHETGHALGLPDYYDYKPAIGPKGALGGLDMMDSNKGDHNCFSKWLLDWITPKIVNSGTVSMELRPSGTSEDAVLVMPNAAGNPFREYFMVQNRTKSGNDDAGNWPGAGLMIWHIDGRLTGSGSDFQFNNSTSAHKLIRLMEADGQEEIENGNHIGDADDFYGPGKAFGATTTPGSNNYLGQKTGVFIKDIVKTANGISATIGIESAHPAAASLPKAAFSKFE